MKMPEAEIEQVRDMFQDAIFQLEAEGRSVQAFASAALLAASEVYAEVHGQDVLGLAYVDILRASEIHAGTAGRA